MDIFISRGAQDPEVRIPFPAEPDIVWPMLRELDEYCASNDPARIAGTSCLVPNLTQYISCADVEDAADIRKLNELAELVDGMSSEEQNIFAGALDAESVNGLDDVLRIASNLGQYEFIEGVTSDKELGGWLVEHGQAGVEFPEAVRPYLDYAGIGGAYYASHGGAYTPNGYVKRRMVEQEQAVEPKSKFSLTLTSSIGTVRLNLPAFQDDLEQAKRVLDLDSLDSAAIVDVEIGYPWADLLDMDSITLHDAHILAKCVREMTDRELKVFGAVLEIEAPNSFSDANITAMYLDDHELVEDSEREYGMEALRYAGAGDELLEILDGFTDFDTLGRFVEGPRRNPAKRFRWGEEPQWNERTLAAGRSEGCGTCGDEAGRRSENLLWVGQAPQRPLASADRAGPNDVLKTANRNRKGAIQ